MSEPVRRVLHRRVGVRLVVLVRQRVLHLARLQPRRPVQRRHGARRVARRVGAAAVGRERERVLVRRAGSERRHGGGVVQAEVRRPALVRLVVVALVRVRVQMVVVRLLVIGGRRRLVDCRVGGRIVRHGAAARHHHAAHDGRRSERGRGAVQRGGRAVGARGPVLAAAGFRRERREWGGPARAAAVDGLESAVRQLALAALLGRVRVGARRVDAGHVVVAVAAGGALGRPAGAGVRLRLLLRHRPALGAQVVHERAVLRIGRAHRPGRRQLAHGRHAAQMRSRQRRSRRRLGRRVVALRPVRSCAFNRPSVRAGKVRAVHERDT